MQTDIGLLSPICSTYTRVHLQESAVALKMQINVLLTWGKNFQHILVFFSSVFCFAYCVFVLYVSCTQGKTVAFVSPHKLLNLQWKSNCSLKGIAATSVLMHWSSIYALDSLSWGLLFWLNWTKASAWLQAQIQFEDHLCILKVSIVVSRIQWCRTTEMAYGTLVYHVGLTSLPRCFCWWHSYSAAASICFSFALTFRSR